MIEYKLVRSKRRKLCVSVANGEVTVKAPIGTGTAEIEQFLADKGMWISKKLVEQKRRNDYLRDVIDCKAVLYHGKFCSVLISDEHKRTAFDGETLFVPRKYADKPSLEKAIALWAKRAAKTELKTALDNLSARTSLKYAEFSLTNARTKWGSCDASGNIMLNWRHIMLENPLVVYVIVHELAHTVHHNHGKLFWARVEKHLPDYKAMRKRLKDFSVLTTLYR